MSAITIENDLVHYEVLGRGRPVIFVHGWLGSWRYWVPTMQQLSMKYRTYALDLWGFGDSGKEMSKYGFAEQVKLLYDFMDKLGIAKAALVGHSLGAAICLRFASQHSDRAPRLALISPPLFDLGGLDQSAVVAQPVTAPAAVSAVPAAASPVTVAAPAGAVPLPAGSVAAPVNPPTPVTANAAPAPAAPAAAPTPSGTIPSAATPAAAPNAQNATPTNTTPAAPPATAPAPVTGDAAPSATTPVTPAGTTASSTDTLPRSPFRGAGETPEEILARLQAKNVVSSAGVAAPQPADTKPLPAGAPALPTNIATPILPQRSAPPASAAPAAPMPGRAEMLNPLLGILTGIKPAALLVKHVDRDAPDLDKLRAEVEKTDEAAVLKSAQSFAGVNLAVELHRLSSPTLLLHGKEDPLLPAPSDDLINQIARGKPEGNLLAFVEPDLRHFPMLEITAKFNRLLMDFLDAQDLTNVQFKDQWRRTMR